MFTILRDNDGVLVDTEGLYFRATRIVLASVGVSLNIEQFQEISLRRGESTFQLAVERGIADERIADLRAQRDRIYAASLAAQPCVIDGAEETLAALHGRVRMGVVTSTRREHFQTAHANSGLMRYLDFVITLEDYRRAKPHPEPYLTALARHGLKPDACVVVEDSPRGLTAATAAGLRCLIVSSPWTREEPFPGALRVLQSIREVPGEVLRLANEG